MRKLTSNLPGNYINIYYTRADFICHPRGSQYSSLIANLLPKGVGAAISSADCPKIFIPNTGSDPEQNGMTLTGMVRTLIKLLKKTRVNPPMRKGF